MKVTIVKYLNQKGKVVEMRKDNFKGSYMPENIIEEYEVEIKGEGYIKTDWLEDLMLKYLNGNYIIIVSCDGKKWETRIGFSFITHYKHIKLIHNKHKDILEVYLKNPSVEIETGMFAPMTGETEPSKWVKLEKDFIEDYNEEFWYRLKVKDLAWYEDKSNFPLILTDISNNNMYLETYPLNEGTKILIKTNNLRPATESEVLSLVYKPQQKISKEEILTESNRLKDLFLNDRAECLVENEQGFRLVYEFLDKNCDEKLNRYLKLDGSFDFTKYNNKFPIILSTPSWGNIYEWDKLQDRDLSKPLIKFNGETFWEVFE